MMDWVNNTVRFDVEVTSHCNAACPGCERNVFGGKVNPSLNVAHMDDDIWDAFLEGTKNKTVRQLEMNGNVGDFTMHPNIIDMLDRFCNMHPYAIVGAQTNGGARNVKFWSELGKVLKGRNSQIGFAIDGIDNDMNHVHRRNVKFDFAMRNAKAFIDAGSNAYWVYTMFDHNLEGMNKARAIADEIGFRRLTFRHSCIDQQFMVVKTEKENYMVGTEKIWDHKEKHVLNDNVGWDTYKESPIEEYTPYESFGNHCTAYNARKINIDWRGYVHPCSYLYAHNITLTDDGVIKYRLNHGSKILWETMSADDISLQKKSLDEILNGKFFKSLDKKVKNEIYLSCATWCKKYKRELIQNETSPTDT